MIIEHTLHPCLYHFTDHMTEFQEDECICPRIQLVINGSGVLFPRLLSLKLLLFYGTKFMVDSAEGKIPIYF